MEYTLIIERRKTISIKIDDKSKVIVKVPLKTTKKIVDKILKDNEDWILDQVKNRTNLINNYDYMRTGKILYFGEYIDIKFEKSKVGENKLEYNPDCGIIVKSNLDEDGLRGIVRDFYKNTANSYCHDRTSYWAKKIGVTYNKISIRNQKTRWGSCSSNKNLSYNLKLICAPKDIIDYVILHEVMHLKYLSHAKQFWNEIEIYMPDYKMRSKYLDEFGRSFII